jgi:DNA polymerase I
MTRSPSPPDEGSALRGTDVGAIDAETELLTATGPQPVRALSRGDRVYALDIERGVATLCPITAYRPVACDTVVRIETRRADLRVSAAQHIPFTTPDVDTPRLARAGTLGERAAYTFLSEWTTPSRPTRDTVDITDWLDDYEMCAAIDVHGNTFRAALPEGCEPCRRISHTGYYFDPATFTRHQAAIEAAADTVTIHAGPNHHRRPYRFDGDDFLRFLGWYVTEGSVHWSATSHTAQVKIAQETPPHRRAIAALCDRLGLTVHRGPRRFEFGSVVFGRLLERLCGDRSRTKRLPDLVWECSTRQQRLLCDVLLRGDGNERGTYYTASDRLAGDVLRLCVECGIKPRYARRDGAWRIYIRDVNDGFVSARHVHQADPTSTMIHIDVRDANALLAGHNGTFQWIGAAAENTGVAVADEGA